MKNLRPDKLRTMDCPSFQHIYPSFCVSLQFLLKFFSNVSPGTRHARSIYLSFWIDFCDRETGVVEQSMRNWFKYPHELDLFHKPPSIIFAESYPKFDLSIQGCPALVRSLSFGPSVFYATSSDKGSNPRNTILCLPKWMQWPTTTSPSSYIPISVLLCLYLSYTAVDSSSWQTYAFIDYRENWPTCAPKKTAGKFPASNMYPRHIDTSHINSWDRPHIPEGEQAYILNPESGNSGLGPFISLSLRILRSLRPGYFSFLEIN